MQAGIFVVLFPYFQAVLGWSGFRSTVALMPMAAVLPGLLAMGIGMGLSMTPSTEAITAALPRERQGVASALNDITREFGTALGVALLGAVLTTGYRTAIEPRLQAIPASAADAARRGIAQALAAASPASPHSHDLIRAARESFVDGWQRAMWSGVAVMTALLIYVLARGPERNAVVRTDGEQIMNAGDRT